MISSFHTFQMKYKNFYHILNDLLIFQKKYNFLLNFFVEIQIIDYMKFLIYLLKQGIDIIFYYLKPFLLYIFRHLIEQNDPYLAHIFFIKH